MDSVRQHDINSDDYYVRLGVTRGASLDEIKSAHRDLAHTYHPDLNGGSAEAGEMFRRLREAYETLSGPDRRQYDRNVRNGRASSGHANNGRASSGHTNNGHASSGHASNGQPSNGQPSNGQPSNSQQGNGQPSNSQQGNGHPSNDPTDLLDALDFFRSPSGETFVSLAVDGCVETYPIRSQSFVRRLRYLYLARGVDLPSRAAIRTLQDKYDALASFEGETHPVFVRLGRPGDEIYLDLANAKHQVITIDAADWRVTNDLDVKFVRPAGMQALPTPSKGGSLDDLWRFVRVRKHDQPLLLGFLVACLHPAGPYPLLMVTGPQGAAKSFAARILRALIDPNDAALRPMPTTRNDLLTVRIKKVVA